MPSLNLDIDYFNHPKTKRLIRLLGKGSEVIPLRLWCYTARYFAEDGRLAGISAQEIEDECCWWGQKGDAVKVMVDCQFLEVDGENFVVHDWCEHEGHIIAFRERAKAGAQARWDGYKIDANGNASSNASSIPRSIAKRNAPTVPTVPNQPTNQNTLSGVPPGFVRFWEEWPSHCRKKSKDRCIAHWRKHKLEEMSDKIIESLRIWKRSEQWARESGQFIPGPFPWLNQQTYNAANPPMERFARLAAEVTGGSNGKH